MRYLILSDTHIGNPAFDESITLSLLQLESFDVLLLNGDIVDLWLTSIYDAQKTKLFRYLDFLSKSKPVVWILGNHDVSVSCINSGIKILNKYLAGPKQEILVLHGHQVYRNENGSLIDRILNKIVYWTWKLFKFDLQIKLNETRSYKKYINHKRIKVLQAFSGFKYIVMGHTHIAGTLQYKDTTLIDTGSCPITRSYVIIDGNTVQLKFF